MHRLVWAPLLFCAACGETEDDRPLELAYLTQAIFEPTCGATNCHSSFARAGDVVLDTPENVRRTLVGGGLVQFSAEKYDPDDPTNANLIVWMTEIDPFSRGIGRMPFDAPIANRDVELLEEWISEQAPGAQCNPNIAGGRACNNKELVDCTADWNFGARVQMCTNICNPATGECE